MTFNTHLMTLILHPETFICFYKRIFEFHNQPGSIVVKILPFRLPFDMVAKKLSSAVVPLLQIEKTLVKCFLGHLKFKPLAIDLN